MKRKTVTTIILGIIIYILILLIQHIFCLNLTMWFVALCSPLSSIVVIVKEIIFIVAAYKIIQALNIFIDKNKNGD